MKQGTHRVVVYPDWCKGCGICAAFCPGKVLVVEPEGKARVVHEAACVNCGFCEPHCPDFAIMVVPRENGPGGPDADPTPAASEPPTTPEAIS